VAGDLDHLDPLLNRLDALLDEHHLGLDALHRLLRELLLLFPRGGGNWRRGTDV
jgi:hypothetical protein